MEHDIVSRNYSTPYLGAFEASLDGNIVLSGSQGSGSDDVHRTRFIANVTLFVPRMLNFAQRLVPKVMPNSKIAGRLLPSERRC